MKQVYKGAGRMGQGVGRRAQGTGRMAQGAGEKPFYGGHPACSEIQGYRGYSYSLISDMN